MCSTRISSFNAVSVLCASTVGALGMHARLRLTPAGVVGISTPSMQSHRNPMLSCDSSSAQPAASSIMPELCNVMPCDTTLRVPRPSSSSSSSLSLIGHLPRRSLRTGKSVGSLSHAQSPEFSSHARTIGQSSVRNSTEYTRFPMSYRG